MSTLGPPLGAAITALVVLRYSASASGAACAAERSSLSARSRQATCDRASPQTGRSGEVLPIAGRWQARDTSDTCSVPFVDPPLAGWSAPRDSNAAQRSTKLSSLPDRAADRYLAYLAARQESFFQRAHSLLGRPFVPRHRYRFAFNGLALALTTEEAQLLAALPEVVRITPSRLRRLATDVGPQWIGADIIWDGRALGQGVGSMGEGVVVGILDTGVRMDHPSFAAVGGDGHRAHNPLGRGRYLGFCDPKHPAYRPEYGCHDKLIGAGSFPEAGNDPQDDNGHGTQTAASGAYGPVPIVYARGYRNLSGQPDDGRCLQPFPTGAFDGQIVDCDRGGGPRIDKGRHVRSGGAVGLVLVNTAAEGEEVWDDWPPVTRGTPWLRRGSEAQ